MSIFDKVLAVVTPPESDEKHETHTHSDKPTNEMPRRGPAGDVRPEKNDPDPRTIGGQPQEKVEDRPSVSIVTPEDYPDDQRAKG